MPSTVRPLAALIDILLAALPVAGADVSALDFSSLAPASGEWGRPALAPGEPDYFSAAVRLRFDYPQLLP